MQTLPQLFPRLIEGRRDDEQFVRPKPDSALGTDELSSHHPNAIIDIRLAGCGAICKEKEASV